MVVPFCLATIPAGTTLVQVTLTLLKATPNSLFPPGHCTHSPIHLSPFVGDVIVCGSPPRGLGAWRAGIFVPSTLAAALFCWGGQFNWTILFQLLEPLTCCHCSLGLRTPEQWQFPSAVPRACMLPVPQKTTRWLTEM